VNSALTLQRATQSDSLVKLDEYGREARRIWTDPSYVCDPLQGPEGGSLKCSARKQAKRGGHLCTEPSVTTTGPPLCRLHFLISLCGEGTCQVLSRAGRPCSHKAVGATGSCPFHIGEGDYRRELRAVNQPSNGEAPNIENPETAPNVENPETTTQGPALEEPAQSTALLSADAMADAIADVQDPDFENELLFLANPIDRPSPPSTKRLQSLVQPVVVAPHDAPQAGGPPTRSPGVGKNHTRRAWKSPPRDRTESRFVPS